MNKLLKDHQDKFRFAFVGILNTAIDFTLFNILSLLIGFPTILSNTISTGIAIIFSFAVNRRWTFKSTNSSYFKQAIIFILLTIFGMWVINNSIVWLLTSLLPQEMEVFLRNNIAKIVATGASLIWNYLSYKYIVFRDQNNV